jgi:hypothetical protein
MIRETLLSLSIFFVLVFAAWRQEGLGKQIRKWVFPRRPKRVEGRWAPRQQRDVRRVMRMVSGAASKVERTKGTSNFSLSCAEDLWIVDPVGRQIFSAKTGEAAGALRSQLGLDPDRLLRVSLDWIALAGERKQGWLHCQADGPGGMVPRWKTFFVQVVTPEEGGTWLLAGEVITPRVDRRWLIDLADVAVDLVERQGMAGIELFRNGEGPFRSGEMDLLIIDPAGVCLFMPLYPELEGRCLLDLRDAEGRELVREMLELVRDADHAWIEYQWPRPGEGAPRRKGAYLRRARLEQGWVLVGGESYLPQPTPAAADFGRSPLSATEMVTLVRQGASILARYGEKAYSEFRRPCSPWCHDEVAFVVLTQEGQVSFDAVSPPTEEEVKGTEEDLSRRPALGRLMRVAATVTGEGWVHDQSLPPGDLFPARRSTYAKRVTFPSGQVHLLLCSLFHVPLERSVIEEVVDSVGKDLSEGGDSLWASIRDPKGHAALLETGLCVVDSNGKVLVGVGQPSLEGTTPFDCRDACGREILREEMALVEREGEGWLTFHWERTGERYPVPREVFVRGLETSVGPLLVAAGFFPPEDRPVGAQSGTLEWGVSPKA